MRKLLIAFIVSAVLSVLGCPAPPLNENPSGIHAGATDVDSDSYPEQQQQHTFFTSGTIVTPSYIEMEQSLIFSSNHQTGLFCIYKKKPDSNDLIEVVRNDFNCIFPAVSPDGRFLAYCNDSGGNWDITITPLKDDGEGFGTVFNLSNTSTDEIHPSWSRDGSFLSFSRYSLARENWEICIYDVATRNTIYPGIYGLFPEFSPAADIITFQNHSESGENWYSIWTYDMLNHTLTERVYSDKWAAINPGWSSDGSKIIFSTVNKSTSGPSTEDIYAIDMKNGRIEQFTHNSYAEWDPFRGNDRTFFMSSRSGVDNIWSIR